MDAPRTTKDFAKTLRRQMSLPEVLIWKELKGRKQGDLRFRRQHPFGPYVLDFYCEQARLAIEIDGDGHSWGDRPEKDQRRDVYLREHGIDTFRVSAQAVLADVDGAVQFIVEACRLHPEARRQLRE